MCLLLQCSCQNSCFCVDVLCCSYGINRKPTVSFVPAFRFRIAAFIKPSATEACVLPTCELSTLSQPLPYRFQQHDISADQQALYAYAGATRGGGIDT